MQTGPEAWRRLAIGGGGGMFVAMGLGRFSYTAMVPAMIASGQLSEVEAGLVGGVNLAGFLLGAWLSETLRRALPIRRLLAGAIGLAVLALAASALPWGFAWLAVWRGLIGAATGLIGAATGLIMVQSLALATAAAPADRRPAAAGHVFAGVGAGIFLSGTLVPGLLNLGLAWAWAGVAVAGLAGAGLAQWGWRAAADAPDRRAAAPASIPRDGAWRRLVAASFLFSLGLVPHTLYWVDYLVRGLDLGLGIGGLHWSVAGLFAGLGPWLVAPLAARIGTAPALVVAFLVLAAGTAGPAATGAATVLWLSTMIFGAQPGLAALLAARARDMGTEAATPRMMRAIIVSNAVGAAIGGVLVPWLFGAAGGHGAVFLLAGAALLLGALCALPDRR